MTTRFIVTMKDGYRFELDGDIECIDEVIRDYNDKTGYAFARFRKLDGSECRVNVGCIAYIDEQKCKKKGGKE